MRGLTFRRSIRTGVALLLVGMLTACGEDSLSGDYIARGDDAFVEKLVFGPGDRVQAVLGDSARVGTFTVNGSQVVVTIGTDQTTLAIDGNCVVSERLGTYCKA